MIIDLAKEHFGNSAPLFDACIVGAGVAGITLAVKLSQAGRRVLLVEAGGQHDSAESQAYYHADRGELENLPPDETRIRALGGSSNHWAGWCRALDAYDFDRSDYSDNGAWPIGKMVLDPYFRDAAAVLGINAASGADHNLPESDGNLQTIRMYFSRPPARLGAKYFDVLEQSKNITLLLNAPFLTAELDIDGAVIRNIAVGNQRTDTSIVFRARYFVFAMGAIENARHLLLLNRKYDNRMKNEWRDLGRYYMQHLHQELGQFIILQEDNGRMFADTRHGRAFIASTDNYLRRNGYGAYRLYVTSLGDCSELIDHFSNVTGIPCSSVAAAGVISITCEQVPNADSRIELTGEVDAMGQSRIKLDWRISDDDRMTMKGAALEFGRYLIRADIGRIRVNPIILDSANPLQGWTALSPAMGAAGHQMGGVRMGWRAGDGVVDRDCRVWGIENLYVAGSAVFRTSGHANPTLTLTQVALRLADTLNRRLS